MIDADRWICENFRRKHCLLCFAASRFCLLTSRFSKPPLRRRGIFRRSQFLPFPSVEGCPKGRVVIQHQQPDCEIRLSRFSWTPPPSRMGHAVHRALMIQRSSRASPYLASRFSLLPSRLSLLEGLHRHKGEVLGIGRHKLFPLHFDGPVTFCGRINPIRPAIAVSIELGGCAA